MLNLAGMTKAPINFEVTMKPTGRPRKEHRIRPEFVVTLTAADRDDAARQARDEATRCGFTYYAICKVREIKQ